MQRVIRIPLSEAMASGQSVSYVKSLSERDRTGQAKMVNMLTSVEKKVGSHAVVHLWRQQLLVRRGRRFDIEL